MTDQPSQDKNVESSGGDPDKSEPANAPTSKAKTHRSKGSLTFNRWERYTAWPMFILSVVFVALTALFISPPKEIGGEIRVWLGITLLFLWLLFIADFVVRLTLSGNPKAFLKTQSFELLTLLIPYLRPFLLIRYVWKLNYFRHKGADGLRQRAILAISIFALSYVYTISTLVWVVERSHEHANIVNWDDAIWWGFVTISTVGYGVYYPVTALGRLLAILMMAGGLFVIGVISATIISGFNNAMSSFLADAAPKSKEESVEHGRALVEALSMGALKTETVEDADSGSDSSPETKTSS